MENKLMVLVDKSHIDVQRVIDVAAGSVKEKTYNAAEICTELGVAFTPMTPALKELVMYERTSKTDGQRTPVRLGSLGPIVLVRIDNGQIQNEFSARDLHKPVPLSLDTVRQLVAIFGGKRAAEQKPGA